MNSNELRIGNWVSFKGFWEGEVDEIMKYSIGIKGLNDNTYPVDGFKGIPLTPELLEKLGAVKANQNWEFPLGGLKMKWRFYDSSIYSELGEIYLSDHIKYLHQLQNLYYALTGEELTINQ